MAKSKIVVISMVWTNIKGNCSNSHGTEGVNPFVCLHLTLLFFLAHVRDTTPNNGILDKMLRMIKFD